MTRVYWINIFIHNYSRSPTLATYIHTLRRVYTLRFAACGKSHAFCRMRFAAVTRLYSAAKRMRRIACDLPHAAKKHPHGKPHAARVFILCVFPQRQTARHTKCTACGKPQGTSRGGSVRFAARRN